MSCCDVISIRCELKSSKRIVEVKISIVNIHNKQLHHLALVNIRSLKMELIININELIQLRRIELANSKMINSNIFRNNLLRTKWWVKSMPWVTQTQISAQLQPGRGKTWWKCIKHNKWASTQLIQIVVAKLTDSALQECNRVLQLLQQTAFVQIKSEWLEIDNHT